MWLSIYSAAGPDLSFYNTRMPPVAGQPATVFYLLKNSPHDRALNQITLDPVTGEIKRHERYSDKSFKAQLLTSLYALHVGSYFGIVGRIILTISRSEHAAVLRHGLAAVPRSSPQKTPDQRRP